MLVVQIGTDRNLVCMCKNGSPGVVTAERRRWPAGSNVVRCGRRWSATSGGVLFHPFHVIRHRSRGFMQECCTGAIWQRSYICSSGCSGSEVTLTGWRLSGPPVTLCTTIIFSSCILSEVCVYGFHRIHGRRFANDSVLKQNIRDVFRSRGR